MKTAGDDTVKCPMCAAHYGKEESRVCHLGCLLSSGCQLLRCPHCGYEVPAETRLTRWLSHWLGSTEEPR